MRLKALVILLLGITITNNLIAAEKPATNHKAVINLFMESYMNSDYKKLKSILSDDAIFTSNRDVRVIKHKASDVISQMKKEEGVKQRDCSISSTIISETDAIVVARVDVSYALYAGDQQNIVVIEKDKEGEWKITQVYKMFVVSDSASKRMV